MLPPAVLPLYARLLDLPFGAPEHPLDVRSGPCHYLCHVFRLSFEVMGITLAGRMELPSVPVQPGAANHCAEPGSWYRS
jgi:hypothetical protein